MRAVLVAAVVVAMLATSVASCLEKSCTAIGCEPGATIRITTVADPSMLDGATLTVCLNDRCSSATLHATDVDVPLLGDVTANGFITSTSSGVDVRAQVIESDVHDGDVYSATITAAGSNGCGATIASTGGTATYHTYYPNGEDCGGGCAAATITQ